MIEIEDWGLIDYNEAWERQRYLVADIQMRRDRNVFVLCQHPSVITIGKSSKASSDVTSEGNITINNNINYSNLIAKPEFLSSLSIKLVETDRGGDVTLHNPGQLVGYPIFNLSSYREDLHWFLREIEECIIRLLGNYNIEGERIERLTGVWVGGRRKICAMGLHCSRWVTSHGFALNVSNDLNEFRYIVPCGIQDKEVTSIEIETGTIIDFDDMKNKCIEIFKNKF